MASIEQTRQRVIDYEQDTAAAQAELQAFEEASGDSLQAIKSEFEDYDKHPLWQEYSQKQVATKSPADVYRYWYHEEVEAIGWESKVLFREAGPDKYGVELLDYGSPERSILPTGVEEFDRRATIAEYLGEVATMLRDHRGEPIVSIASYPGSLRFKKPEETKLKNEAYAYTDGQVSQLPKTRTIVGAIDQPNREPVLTTQDPNEEDTSQGLRLTLASSVAGAVSAYSFPYSKRQLKQQMSPPYYSYRSVVTDNWKYKKIPFGNSVIGDFSLDQLRGHDLLVIDGPHRTADDHEFSDDILLHRPKQKVETDGLSRDQEIAVTPGKDAKVYEATIVSEDRKVSLPTLRHDTIWLVGAKAIEANLIDAIWDLAPFVSQRRSAKNEAILRATRDLIKFASSGQPAAELAA